MKKLLLINLGLLFFLSVAIMFYSFQLINDTLLAFIVIPIFGYFIVLKEKVIVRPSNQLKKEFRQKN